MRIIKRGRRHIVISPSDLPVEEAHAPSKPRSTATSVVRFDQLPVDLQRVLRSRPAGATMRAK
jgi:hypothetical protein